MAGLISCPLTLFIMNFTVLHRVVEVGVLFALAMMVGISVTLATVAVLAVLLRERFVFILIKRPILLERLSRQPELSAGLVLLSLTIHQLVHAGPL